MKNYDCSSCCEGSLCSECASLETSSTRDDSHEITVNEQPFVPRPPCESITRYLPVGNDNSFLSLSNSIPRDVPHSEQDLICEQPSHGGLSQTEGDHPPDGTTVKVEAKCYAMTKLGRNCTDVALPGSVYCCNHTLATQAVSIDTVNSRIVHCCGKTYKGKQCKGTVKTGYMYCGNHSHTVMVSVRCCGKTYKGKQCKGTAKAGYLYCGNHSETVMVSVRCCGKTYKGKQCKDTAKAGYLYCGNHSETDMVSVRCCGKTNKGKQCKGTAKTGSLYCGRNHTVPVTTQSVETDTVQMRVTTKDPDREQFEARAELFVDNSHTDLQQVNRCSDTVDKQMTASGQTSMKSFTKHGDTMDRSHPDLQEDRSSETGLEQTTGSGQVSKKSVDKNGGAINAHWHNGKASFRSAHSTYLTAWHDGGVTLQPLAQDWERWTMVSAENGKIALRSFHGKYLSARDDGKVATAPHAKQCEKWTQVQNGDGSVSFRSWLGTYLSASPDGRVRQSDNHLGWEHWYFVADSPDLPEPSDPLEKIARLHIPRKLELQNLLKAWVVAHREGSRSPISSNLIFRGPRGSGKKTVARVVFDVLRALGLASHVHSFMSVAEFCDRFLVGIYGYAIPRSVGVMFVDATTFLTYSLDKQEHYRQTIIKSMLSNHDLSREVVDGKVQDFLFILAGSRSEIDFILNGKPPHQSPRVHVFDFPSMEATDCAGYFETLAMKDGFSLGLGVLQTIEELSLAAKDRETWTNGRTMKTLWGETKLQVAHSGVFNNQTNPYHSQDDIPKTIGHSCVRDAYRTMLNGPCTEIKLRAARPKLDSLQKVRDEVLSLLRNISWPKESDTLDIGNFLFRGPKGSGKKTAAHVVADVLFDFGLKSSKKVVVRSAQSHAFPTSTGFFSGAEGPPSAPSGGILVIDVSKDFKGYTELTEKMRRRDCEDVLIIIAGDYSDVANLETRPEMKNLFRHVFDFASWEERDCVDLFERHARREGFLIGGGVRKRVSDGCCKCRARNSCNQGHDVDMLWELVKRHRALRVYEIPETTRTIQCDDMEVVDSML